MRFSRTLRYSYRHSHFVPLHAASRQRFSAETNAPLLPSAQSQMTHNFGAMLSPVEFSAQNYSTSELLRTLSRIAASKLTSWLSSRFDILAHLELTWGP